MPLDEQDLIQIRAIVTEVNKTSSEALKSEIKTEVMESVNSANSGMAASVKRKMTALEKTIMDAAAPKEDPAPKDDSTEPLANQVLQQQLEDLRAQLAEQKQANDDRDRQLEETNKRTALSTAILKQGFTAPSTIEKAFWGDYMGGTLDIQKEGDQHYIRQGSTVTPLDDFIESYASSEEGKVFLPASSITGTNAQETIANTPAPPALPDTEMSAENALAEAF